ncbi:ACP S-malonyltransferase [Myxacorys almedinensis]|uniref:Malonyl CoA-acyl carrier protein transacylase n=1 Tax=Myxacorys almedinensis A TaxID=2690445 RepID=A0A8J7Z3C7_9CYAN|nr:ACP S-malonyltransferase [Myxacorys almedinensis]NDJ17081.1 ACP S-malonyltransferase [Myxacorys almedinensis A]
MTHTAWVFPGQGSQAIGMGTDLLDVPAAKARFEQAEQLLGWSVVEICQHKENKVSQTRYTQPCMYVVETVLADLLTAKGQRPNYVAGHSLGEYAALYTAGVFDFESGLRLIQRRAELMDSASDGMMAALLGCDRSQLDVALAQTTDVVLANDNNDGQVVISGTPDAVEAMLSQVKSKRAIRLNVSGAFHSPLMAEAANQFNPLLESVEFQPANIPVLSNVDPLPSTDATALKDRLRRQMTGTVRWREISTQFAAENVQRVIEVGPGKVLTGIIKRTCPNLVLENIGSIADLPT